MPEGKEAKMETPGESLTDEREPDRAVPPDAPVETPEADPRTKGAPGGPGSTSERDEEERWGLVADADERAGDGTRMMDQPARRSRGTKKMAKRSSAKRSTAKRGGAKRGGAKTTAKRGGAKKTTAKRGGAKKTTAKRFSAKKSTAKRPGPTRKKW
jgi:hypothetical protein